MRCLALIVCLAIAGNFYLAAAYKSEVVITPDPLDSLETTTKKSSWFGGFKKFFGSGDSTTTTTTTTESSRNVKVTSTTPKPVVATPTAAQKPPPLVISHAPLMPLGPRPDTPGSTPFGASPPPASGPQWPSTTATSTKPPQHSVAQTGGGAPNLPPGFAPYRPQKPQPNSYDLSYGGGVGPGTGRPGFGLVNPISSSTTTTTTQRPKSPGAQPNIDIRFSGSSSTSTTTTGKPHVGKEDFPALPGPRRPSIKEDFPALPTPKSPGSGSPTPTPGSPSAWQSPLPTPQHPVHPPTKAIPTSTPTPTTSTIRGGTGGVTGHGGLAGHSGITTSTVRPGFQTSGNSVATDDEIRQLTEQLYTKETNSQLGNIQVNLQGRTRSIDSADEAPNPLLRVDAKALDSPTIAKMRVLFNNYETDTLVNEHVTPNERKEENDFLDAVMATPVMRQAMQFLQQKGLVSPDPKTHRDLVKELWFTQYSRGQGKIGSSGFEHVFVHEVKDGTIIGFHNWVYISEEEQAGRLDYKGYMKEQDIGTKGKVVKIRFSHQGLNKPVNTVFVGTSPELELALYTVCFQLRPDRTCPVSLGNSKFGIITYSWRYRGKNLIGSAYPEI